MLRHYPHSNRLQKIDPDTLTLIGQEISLNMPIDRLEANQWFGSGLTWDSTRLIGSFCPQSNCSTNAFMQINTATGDVNELFRTNFPALGLGFDEKTSTYWVGGANGNVYNLSSTGQVLSSFVADQRNMVGFEFVEPISDLSIAKTDSPDPVGLGQELTYTLIVTNHGPDTAVNVIVTDTLPSEVTFVSAAPNGCNNNNGIVTCNLGSLDKDATATVTIVVTPTAEGTITNNATVQSDATDPNPSDNTATETTEVRPPKPVSDLSITKTDAPDPVGVGQQLTYMLTVTNNGPSAADNVVITDTLPANVTFVSASTGCSNSASTVTCTISSINASQTATVTIVVTPTVAGTITNSASVQSSSLDFNSANDTATALTTVKLVSDLVLSKTASTDSATVGKRLTYTLTVTNNGPDAASGVVVTDTLPTDTDVKFVSVTPSLCTVSGSTVTCNLSGSLAKDSNSAIMIVVKPLTEGTITNTATVTSNNLDPTNANNSASVDTTVRLASCDRTDLLGAVCALRFSVSNIELLFNLMSHGLYETLIAINNGRNLISQKRADSLVEASIELASEEIESIAVMFDEPRSLIDSIHEQIGAALGEVQALFESPDLSPALAALLTKIKLKLETVELTLAQIGNEWDFLPGLSLKGAEKQEFEGCITPPASNLGRDPSSLGRGSYSTAWL